MVDCAKKPYDVFVGDASCAIDLDDRAQSLEVLSQIQNALSLQRLMLLKQEHSFQGVCITKDTVINTPIDFRRLSGDFLITDQGDIGIGVLTADCLPVILHDSKNQVIGIVHAGWHGSANGIVYHVVRVMQKLFGSNPLEFSCFLGPSACVCCYEVGEEVISPVAKCVTNSSLFFECRDDKRFFNLPAFNVMQLVNVGVLLKNIDLSYHCCTICNRQFCSYRVTKSTKRQVTIAVLRFRS